MTHHPRVIVVGGGLAGLAATVRIAEENVPVDLFSMVPVKRSHSVCAQGGINACNDVSRQQGYSEWLHMDETLYGGDFLQHQPPVYEMCYWAPKIIDLMDRIGVPFNRTAEANRDLRLFGGSLFKRTHFAGATTGQQLIYALDEQTRRHEADGRVQKYEFWEFLWPVVDDGGICRGIVAQDIRTMQIRSFPADAVVMATGGCGLIFGKSTMSVICTGGAASRCYQAGAALGNPEFIQVHPTAIPGQDKCRLMSESARGEGGRVWVPRRGGDDRPASDIPDSDRWYFLEEKYPKYGNLVPRDIATREIFEVCQQGHGVGGGRMVYLDVSHLPEATKKKLEGILEIYEKFVGDDPRRVPMKIFPAVHYAMGGLYTHYTPKDDFKGMFHGAPNNMMTTIRGMYAFGEVNYQYHGATRLGANALLSCIFDGIFCGLSVVNYVRDEVVPPGCDVPDSLFERFVQQEKAKAQRLIDTAAVDGEPGSSGPEGSATEGPRSESNPYLIHRRLGEAMNDACTVVRTEARMRQCQVVLQELKQQYRSVRLSDTGTWTNQNLSFTRALGDMLIYADAILAAAMARTESRGSHFRPDFPQRDDENWHRTTVARYDASNDRPVFEYEPVPTPLVPPRARTYGRVEAEEPEKPKTEAVAAERQ